MARTPGLQGHILHDPEITGPDDSYALFVRQSDGHLFMVHSEGVAYSVTDEKPWRWNDFNPACPSYTPADLLEAALQAPTVDLTDWIRVFGARLENNFHLIRMELLR